MLNYLGGRWLYPPIGPSNRKSYFKLHLLRRRWLRSKNTRERIVVFQSTPSSQKVTPTTYEAFGIDYISIHTFFAEGDKDAEQVLYMSLAFQSTPSSQKVTGAKLSSGRSRWHFNPHLLRRRWQDLTEHHEEQNDISIHTFFAEGDDLPAPHPHRQCHFNPHLLRRRWRFSGFSSVWKWWISIHTFFAEGDKELIFPL